MAVSHYFNNYSGVATNEQRVFEDIIVESIKIMGHDVYYLPRDSYDSIDEIFGERPESVFAKAYVLEMYLANVEGYEGDGDFFSKFGLEIRDTSNFVVARQTFQRWIPTNIASRPREGDLIYVPVLQKIFEIKFVEEELMFFSLGKKNPYVYELRCEVLRFSQEDINTGVEEIDEIERISAYTVQIVTNGQSNNIDYIKGETVYQGNNITTAIATAEVKEWQPSTKILQVVNVKGTFLDATNLIGATSNAQHTTADIDTTDDFNTTDEFDNKQLQTEADAFIDFSEINPFGKP